MSVHRCPRCRRHIQWLTTKFTATRDGYRRPARLPFDYQLVDVGALAGRDGWIAGKNSGGGSVVMVPLTHTGSAVRAAARRVLVVHQCATEEGTAGWTRSP